VNLRPNTRAAYTNLLRRYLLPTFNLTPLADLDPLAVRAWLAGMEAAGIGASTRAKSYRLLSGILAQAVEAGYLSRNPCMVRGAASEPTTEMRFATVDQVAELAEAMPPRFKALVLVAAYTGLRWGELAGLRVKRVDLLHRRTTVAEQLTETRGAFAFGPPKTAAGMRTVTLPMVAATALADHLAAYAEPGPDGLVFPAERRGPLRRSNFNPPGLDAGHPGGRGRRAAPPRPAPYRRNAGDRGRGEHPGADGAPGAFLLGGGASLPARHGRPGRRHRGRP
jgi:integrase